MERATEFMVELLGKGYSQVEVARIAEVSESAVSQICTKYSREIAEVQMESAVAARANDQKYDELEAIALERMEKVLPFETDIVKLQKVLSTLNSAKRRSQGEHLRPAEVTNNTLVMQLQMPERMQRQVQHVTNAQNEIVEAGGRHLTSASIKQIQSELANPLDSLPAVGTTHEHGQEVEYDYATEATDAKQA